MSSYRQAKLQAQGGEYGQANRRHEYAYGVLLRSYGSDNPKLLPGLFVLADWYMTRYNIFSARALYEHAANVADGVLADYHPAHIRALRSLAATYRNERFPPFYTRRSGQASSARLPQLVFNTGRRPTRLSPASPKANERSSRSSTSSRRATAPKAAPRTTT